MANIVFGNPVTDDTARDRAHVALQLMNPGDEDEVRKFVHNLKTEYGDGTSTLCMIHNTTGGDLKISGSHDWEGYVWKYPCPQLIKNGQWAGFLHVHGDNASAPSKGAVVYTGTNNDGLSCDWTLAWETAKENNANHVYTVIRDSSAPAVNWDSFSNAMEKHGNHYEITALGCFSSVDIGSGSSPDFKGIISLEGLAAKSMAMASDVSTTSQSLDSKYGDVADDACTPPAAAAAK